MYICIYDSEKDPRDSRGPLTRLGYRRRDVAKTLYLYATNVASLATMSRKDRCENAVSAESATNNRIISGLLNCIRTDWPFLSLSFSLLLTFFTSRQILSKVPRTEQKVTITSKGRHNDTKIISTWLSFGIILTSFWRHFDFLFYYHPGFGK